MFQAAGYETSKIRKEWKFFSDAKQNCDKERCKSETEEMSKIIVKNMKKTLPEISSPEEETNLQDKEYLAWKNWLERNEQEKQERQERLEDAKRKEENCSLYRECSRIIQENQTRWLERRENERQKRLEQEKKERLAEAARKKVNTWKKNHPNPKPKKKNQRRMFQKAGKRGKIEGHAENEVRFVEAEKRKRWVTDQHLEQCEKSSRKETDLDRNQPGGRYRG